MTDHLLLATALQAEKFNSMKFHKANTGFPEPIFSIPFTVSDRARNIVRNTKSKLVENPDMYVIHSTYRKKEHVTVPMTAYEAENKIKNLQAWKHKDLYVEEVIQIKHLI